MSTTRWTDTATDDLNTAVDLLIDTVANDERVSTLTWDNWQLSKAYDKTQTMILNGRNIKYNFINYSYDQISSGTRPVEDRTVKKSGFIIAYHNGISINCHSLRGLCGLKCLFCILIYSML